MRQVIHCSSCNQDPYASYRLYAPVPIARCYRYRGRPIAHCLPRYLWLSSYVVGQFYRGPLLMILKEL